MPIAESAGTRASLPRDRAECASARRCDAWSSHRAEVAVAVERSNAHLDEGEYLDRVRLALHVRLAERPERNAITAQPGSGVAREDRIDVELLRQRLHPRGRVHRVADGVVLRTLGQTDRPEDDIARVDADPELDNDITARGAFGIERGNARAHRERGPGRGERAVRRIAHRAERGHHAVAGELVEDPAGVENTPR